MTFTSSFDHLAITAEDLSSGSDFVADRLGVRPLTGGQHTRMGTHNELLRIGQSIYLEVICIDPSAPAPARPRWFGLDHRTPQAQPQLTNWILKTDSIEQALAQATEPLGRAVPMARGSFEWLISIPDDGSIAMDGVGPTLIEWQCRLHPTEKLPDLGCQLIGFEIEHNDPARLATLNASLRLTNQVPVTLKKSNTNRLKAYFETPRGLREL
jgi:hypothetical protein